MDENKIDYKIESVCEIRFSDAAKFGNSVAQSSRLCLRKLWNYKTIDVLFYKEHTKEGWNVPFSVFPDNWKR